MIYAEPCRCSRPLCFADDPEHCSRCGRGPCSIVLYGKRPARRRRLPWDLGALQREGRHPDPQLENVVRLDRLRPGPRLVPPMEWDEDLHEIRLMPTQARVLALAAAGLSNEQIASALGKPVSTVQSHLSQAYRRIGLEPSPGPGGAARAAAVAWWREHHEGRLAA